MLPASQSEDDDRQDEFLAVDFHPDEPNPPSTQTFSTYLENLRNTLNVFLKKRLKDPIL